MNTSSKNSVSRKEELTNNYFQLLDIHLEELVSGKITEMLELNDIAKRLFVSHQHLIAIIQETKGAHPCYFYVQRILNKIKSLLSDTDLSIAEIARQLTYDPSNFNKFFKKHEGQTPGTFRRLNKKPKSSP